ncbi:hypothetical protein Pint_11490 [Pistacia integerrima]|uniref:Uncharacterized protein n=1 Tax=Pistacia integerrima TaxID=434235 RepID=A0ACC0XEE5_9ROSI|nr:hypothetical protein Pint_11490 [Pistacia integerrima]
MSSMNPKGVDVALVSAFELNELMRKVKGFMDLSFAIKCGGGDVMKVDKIVYEADDYDLVTGTTIPELYRISRQFPGSLRYYGLSLENGPYNVKFTGKFWEPSGQRRQVGIEEQLQRQVMLWSTMSNVVNMPAGDIEVETFTSKPSYLTDWNYKDITNSLLSEDIVTSSSTRSYSRKKSHCDSATDLSPRVDPLLSPKKVTRFSDIIAEGRHTVFSYFTPTVGIGRNKNQTGLIVGFSIALASFGLVLIFLVLYMRINRDNDDAGAESAKEI